MNIMMTSHHHSIPFKQRLETYARLLSNTTTAELPLNNKSNYILCAIRNKSQTILVDENCFSSRRSFSPKYAFVPAPFSSSIKIPLKFYKKISFQKFSHLYLCNELARRVARRCLCIEASNIDIVPSFV